MMKYYQEIILIPQMDVDMHAVWSQLYTQLHLAFVEQKDEQDRTVYGVSFPQYRMDKAKNAGALGFKCRVFAPSEQQSQALNLDAWLKRLDSCLLVGRINPVPDTVTGHACYSRKRPKKPLEARICHQAQRHQVSYEQALAYYQAHVKHRDDSAQALPYIRLTSQSTKSDDGKKHVFNLHINKVRSDVPKQGLFNVYGLSDGATVPEF